jgi:hypothetical protein
MAKVITFSRTFPKYHPKAGEPTYFVEQFWNSIQKKPKIVGILNDNPFIISNGIVQEFIRSINIDIDTEKHHTIRAGKRFKKGDFFSPRVWGTDINPKSGKSGPYHSKQIILAPDTEILEVWDIEIDKWQCVYINGTGKILSVHNEIKIANNDGLKVQDFFDWFPKLPFSGQIICWNENVKY